MKRIKQHMIQSDLSTPVQTGSPLVDTAYNSPQTQQPFFSFSLPLYHADFVDHDTCLPWTSEHKQSQMCPVQKYH